ncbi:hypothetical protein HP439_14415 [Sphingobacterium shayense]|uniref:hypothetical protein n=1 Tax=Sphingobacterium shayense TaxID=626343 RepID=UPI0015523389|nr:hypothetical protein [Sphingobacterium shayense]NQD71917.1 hypothetical protein [Sphingobacterium shayense]
MITYALGVFCAIYNVYDYSFYNVCCHYPSNIVYGHHNDHKLDGYELHDLVCYEYDGCNGIYYESDDCNATYDAYAFSTDTSHLSLPFASDTDQSLYVYAVMKRVSPNYFLGDKRNAYSRRHNTHLTRAYNNNAHSRIQKAPTTVGSRY